MGTVREGWQRRLTRRDQLVFNVVNVGRLSARGEGAVWREGWGGFVWGVRCGKEGKGGKNWAMKGGAGG